MLGEGESLGKNGLGVGSPPDMQAGAREAQPRHREVREGGPPGKPSSNICPHSGAPMESFQDAARPDSLSYRQDSYIGENPVFQDGNYAS